MKTFVILGMHRSATSLAAQGLARAGVHMGDRLLGASPSNRFGHFEDVDFISMNDRILSAAGGTWDSPPDPGALTAAAADMEKEIETFIRKKQRPPFWGWKDPRTTLTIRAYLPFLEQPHFITCWRDPLAIVDSLYRRDGMRTADAVALVRTYNDRLLEFLTEWYR